MRAAVAKQAPKERLAAIKYDVKLAQAREREGRKPESEEKRVQRVSRQQESQVQARRLRRLVVEVINREKLVPGLTNERHLQAYAAKLARILRRAPPADRADAAEAAFEQFISASDLPRDLVRPIHDAVVRP